MADKNVSPVVQKINEQRAAEAAATTAAEQPAQTEAPVVQQTTSEAPAVTEKQESNEVPVVDVTQAKEPPVIIGSFENPAPEQKVNEQTIDLNKVTQEAVKEQAAAAAPAAPEAKKNFYLPRAKQLFDNYEKETGPTVAFNAASFAKVHSSLNSFLFDALTKAQSKEFIELMDYIVERMRDPAKRKDYYNAQRFFRGGEKCTESYAALINVLFDMSNKINRQRLMSVNFQRVFGKVIGDKLSDYINRI